MQWLNTSLIQGKGGQDGGQERGMEVRKVGREEGRRCTHVLVGGELCGSFVLSIGSLSQCCIWFLATNLTQLVCRFCT